MEEETTMMIPTQGMDEDMGEGIASLPEQGDSGIADLPQAAQQLAQLGRAQDTFLGHLEQDEVVIPSELLQASPELEDMIRNVFEAEGMDYSRYVVGSDENSINPETGLPEFNPFKKLERAVRKPLKKAGRKIEKAVRKPVKKAGRQLEKSTRKKFKKIARELKRAAPVVLPIALTLLAGPGGGVLQQMLISGAGSGISTLIAGGDFKDALKNAAISAAITGAISGTQQALAPKELAQTGAQEGVKEGVKSSAEQAAEATTKALDANQKDLIEKGIMQDPKLVRSTTSPSSTTGFDISADIKTPKVPVPQPKVPTVENVSMGQQIYTDPTKGVFDIASGEVTRGVAVPPPPPPTSIPEKIAAGYNKTKDALGTAYDATKSGLGKTKDFIYPTGEGSKRARDELMADYIKNEGMGVDAAKFLANKETGYSMLRQFGPVTALGIAGLKASGAFGGAEEEESEEARAFREQLAEDRAIAANIPQMGSPAGIDYITGAQTLAGAPNYSYLNPLYQGGYFLNNPTLTTGVAMARRGGEMAMTNLDVSKFPRRTGRISGPGTETSDSIPAMLSDGEFVMNARAVRGAGNGSREAGVRKMYDMMRNFESKVA